MTNTLAAVCENFIENRDTIKSALGWESAYLYPVCAAIFTDKGMRANREKLLYCRDVLKAKTGIFSNFRGYGKLAMISILATGSSPEDKLQKALVVYDALKGHFYSSPYLPVTSMILAELVEPEQYSEIAMRTRRIYNLMKKEHPFLTSGEDSV